MIVGKPLAVAESRLRSDCIEDDNDCDGEGARELI